MQVLTAIRHRVAVLVCGMWMMSAGLTGQDPAMSVVLLVADDMGWTQSGCYGSTFYQTPNIDRLASRGMRFTSAYAAAAVCSPTRASILSGKYPARLHLTDFIPGGGTGRDDTLSEPPWQKWLPLEELTLAEVFRAAETPYNTAIYGKWHLSRDKKLPLAEPFNPGSQGFLDELVTFKPNRHSDPEYDPHNTDLITNAAIKFLDHQSGRPFFLVASYNAIHDPLMEATASVAPYTSAPGAGDPRNNPVIAAMLERMDRGIGRILDKVDQLGIGNRTIIVFISDNGGKSGHALQSPLRAGKGWLYEGGIRVPLIISWPGVTSPGSVCDFPVISQDLFPTLAAAAFEFPSGYTDGIDLKNLLKGAEGERERPLFWHYPHYHQGSGMRPASAVRKGRYKLIEWHEPLLTGDEGAYELYDLEMDLSEGQNMVEKEPEIADELISLLREWKSATNAQMPVLK